MAAGGIGALTVSIGLDAAQFTDGLSKAQQQAKQFSDTITKQAAAIGVALAGAFSAVAFVDLVKGAIDAADHLNDLSKKTGIAVDTLGGIGFAASQAGGDLESATAATGKLNKSLAEAAAGNVEAGAAFKALGIAVKDSSGQTRDAGSVLVDVAAKFSQYADGPEKSALALKIFGKAGADMIPVLDDGAASLQANIAYFQRYSGVTKEVAEQADAFNDTLGKVNLINKSLGTTIAAETLPVLQQLADAYLAAKENSTLFTTAAGAVRVVLETVAVVGRTVIDTFAGIGDTIGAAAAGLAAIARGEFEQAHQIKIAYDEASEARRKAGDEFNKKILGPKDTLDGGTNLFAGQTPKKPPAPGLPDTTAAANASAILKKQLDGQIKLIQDFAKSQADALQFVNAYAEAEYEQGLSSQKAFFDSQSANRAAALANQLKDIDAEIAAQRKFASNKVASPTDRVAAEEKIKLLTKQRSDVVQKAANDDSLALLKNAAAVQQLQDRYNDFLGTLAQGAGNDAAAANIRIGQQVRDAATLLIQAGQDPSAAAALGVQLKGISDLAIAQKDYAKLLQASASIEAQVFLDAQAGGKGELETLAAVRDARQGQIEQLRQAAEAARALADAVGSDEAKKFADDLALAFKKAAAEIDPLAAKFNSLFEDSFSNAFTSFITGTKSAKDAFKDFAASVISEIANIAAKNLAKQIFGDVGGSSGLGGILSSLFGLGSFTNPGVTQGSGAIVPSGTPLASGTNYVPYDGFKATLHKGEAVVPAKYNATAGGRGGGDVFITNNAPAQVSTSRDSNGQLQIVIDAAVDQAHTRVASDLASGTGIASQGLKNRFGVGSGNLPKRG